VAAIPANKIYPPQLQQPQHEAAPRGVASSLLGVIYCVWSL
jgi:hypothetical protein